MKKEDAFPLPLKGVFRGKHSWELTANFKYINPPISVIVPKGFLTDGGSLPRIVWTLIGSPWSGRYPKACVPHDWHYWSQTITRKEADRQFLDGMEILGVSWWKRRLMYRVVRLVAWICWNKRAINNKN